MKICAKPPELSSYYRIKCNNVYNAAVNIKISQNIHRIKLETNNYKINSEV